MTESEPTTGDAEDRGKAPDTDDNVESSWDLKPGDVLVPGCLAWKMLGQGKRFEVWLCWNEERWVPVCVKLPRSDAPDESTLNALQREFNSAAAFNHVSIPQVLEANFTAPVPFIVYEFIEGMPLSDYIDDHAPLEAVDVAYLGIDLASALRHIHENGFVHLDIKPANILMREGRAVVIDFDLALKAGVVRSTTKPRGTRQYMAPEQVRCEPANTGMDVFALGAVLYKAACGVRAFSNLRPGEAERSDSASTGNLNYRQLHMDAVPIQQHHPLVPDELAQLIHSMMSRKAAERPGRAAEVLSVLHDFVIANDQAGRWPSFVEPALTTSSA